MGLSKKLSYGARWLPGYAWQRLTRRASSSQPVQLIIALADHFEPAIVAGDGRARVTELVDADARGFYTLATPLLKRLVERTIRRDYGTLKQLLEEGRSSLAQ